MPDSHDTGETAPLPPMPPLPRQQPAPPAYPFRLLHDERVLATYPITDRRRLMGRIRSFLFVTDSRVVYAAESKTVFSSSAEFQEHRLDKIEGIETRRRRGFSAVGAAIAIGILLHMIFLGSVNLMLTASLASSSLSSYSSYNPVSVLPLGLITGLLIAFSAVIGGGVIFSLMRPTAYLGVFGVGNSVAFAESRDWITIVVTAILFLVLGPIALLFWIAARGLGLFQASDAFLYADVNNIEAIAYDAGALILDAQSRGTLAGT
ncbi:hypothetical protein [Microbacterium sp. CJ88]|uniref:hypothetical protein n=1 Tax=Microbacterium sp. CJ88 TaxID=3445672 RepID=UPI003F657656